MLAANAPLPGEREFDLLDSRRSAHASIRGYLYQTCLGVLRWLDLQPNEVLLCEGDEDLDRYLLDGGAVSEQVKAYTGGLSLTDRVVRDSLRNFLRSYVTLRRRGQARRFVFTTTAHEKRKRAGGLDLLQAWKDGNRKPEVIDRVRGLVEPPAKDPKAKQTERARAWLDAETRRWPEFMDSVEWTFDAPDLDQIRQTLRNRLAARPDARLLDAENLSARLIVHVLETSTHAKPKDRTLTTEDLTDLLAAARTDLAAWAASPRADRIRAVFDEVDQIQRLLVDGTSPLPENPAPGKLLTAAYEVIPFNDPGRREELEFLAKWCEEEPRRSVLLLTGEGGSGKTRLMIEWCRRLRHQGWHAGFLRRDRHKKDLDPLMEGSAPRMVVVDYAETRLGIVQPLLLKSALAAQEEGPKLRMILLARRQADWWEGFSPQDREIGDLLAASPPPRWITPLIPQNVEERSQAFRAAVEGFARQLGKDAPSVKTPNLSGDEFGRALYLHMAALAALQGKQIETAEDALKETLEHEKRFWGRQVRDVETNESLAVEVESALTATVAALTLVQGAPTEKQARSLLERVLQPFPLQTHHPRTVARLLQSLYGGSAEQNGRYVEPLQPDLLGEELAAEILSREKEILGRILEGGTPEEGYAVLTVLTRLARRHSKGEEWIGDALQGRLESLAEIALNVAVETGDPTGLVLAKAVAEIGDVGLVLALQRRCDEDRYTISVPLREVAHVTTERSYLLLRERKADLDEEQQAELARLASNLGERLSRLGRREDALLTTEEAVQIRRQLAQRRPDAFLPDLATSLNNLGNRLNDLGHREDALQATEEAVQIYRQLALRRPDAFLPVLATSLNNLGIRLSELGRREGALLATEEAVQIYRQLAQRRPDAFLPDLAMSLNNLGNRLSDLGRREDALIATGEAVQIYRQLAQRRPDAFLPDLAMSLNNLGNSLSDLGRREDALIATEEAVQIRRQLAQRRPDAFLPDLATSLNTLGTVFSELGRREDALIASEEAVQIYRQLAQRRPEAFLPDLAMSLNNLGNRLNDFGRADEAALAAEEAVRSLSSFFLRLPTAFASWMETMVRNYLARSEAAGKEPDWALLGPIVEALKSLSSAQEPEA